MHTRALRLLGWDKVKVMQDGYEGWKAKGSFEANQRAQTSRALNQDSPAPEAWSQATRLPRVTDAPELGTNR